MAYTKHTWQCGESISADLLNHMEQGIEDASGGGSGDCGYECVTAYTEILNESVTTADDGYGYNRGNLSEAVYDIPQIRVTLNGTEYICEYDVDSDAYGAPYDGDLGDYDWSEYPFVIAYDALGTPNAGTYSLKIESVNETVETTECFAKARGYSCEVAYKTAFNDDVVTDVNNVADNGYFSDTVTSNITEWSDTIRVTFEGVEYIVESALDTYGAPYDLDLNAYDWSEYPFNIVYLGNGDFTLTTENAGTHSVEIGIQVLEATTTECFNAAVKTVINETVPNFFLVRGVAVTEGDASVQRLNKTPAEIKHAYDQGQVVAFNLSNDYGNPLPQYHIPEKIEFNMGLADANGLLWTEEYLEFDIALMPTSFTVKEDSYQVRNNGNLQIFSYVYTVSGVTISNS